jgi:hypothetical protein
MFRAVRGWFDSGGGGRTLRLFVFELTVVTLGVLIAQSVQSLAQERADRRHMEDERARARHELQRVHLTADEWLAAIPCLDRRMADIMSGRSTPNGLTLARPSFVNPSYTPPDDAAMVLIDRYYGHKEAAVLFGMTVNTANVRNVLTKMVDNWGRLGLIDPANGVVSASDRTAARVAAADIKAQLHSASIINVDIANRVNSIGIGVSDDENPLYGPAHSCAAIWRSGRMDPPLTMR